MKQKRFFIEILFLLISGVFVLACNTEEKEPATQAVKKTFNTNQARITFIELGSVKCVPCRQMQPVMRAIEEKFAGQVQVIFYDVWQKDQNHFAYDYHINLIPTQIFLDTAGKEILRHEGFFPEEKITEFLKQQGLTR